MNAKAHCALFALLFAFLSGVQGQSSTEIPPIPPGFESRCIFPGLTYLQGCEAELSSTLSFLGLEDVEPVEGENPELEAKLVEYLGTDEAKPSAKCCKAFCGYSNEICACEPIAREYTASFFGSEASFVQFLTFYTGLCGTTDLFNDCPADPSGYMEANEPLNDCESLGAEEIEMAPDMEPVSEGLDDLTD